MNILWFSRHKPTQAEKNEIQRIYGDVDIIQKHVSISHGKEVANIMRSNECEEVFVVLPMKYKKELIDQGIKPIHAVMSRSHDSKNNVHFSFHRFERLHSIDIKKEIL